MTSDDAPEIRLDRVLTAVETIGASLGVLARKGRVDRGTYERDPDTRDVVERRFVKATEAALDIGTEPLRRERDRLPESNPVDDARARRGRSSFGRDGRSEGTSGPLSERAFTHLRGRHRSRCRIRGTTGPRTLPDVRDSGSRLPRFDRSPRRLTTVTRPTEVFEHTRSCRSGDESRSADAESSSREVGVAFTPVGYRSFVRGR